MAVAARRLVVRALAVGCCGGLAVASCSLNTAGTGAGAPAGSSLAGGHGEGGAGDVGGAAGASDGAAPGDGGGGDTSTGGTSSVAGASSEGGAAAGTTSIGGTSSNGGTGGLAGNAGQTGAAGAAGGSLGGAAGASAGGAAGASAGSGGVAGVSGAGGGGGGSGGGSGGTACVAQTGGAIVGCTPAATCDHSNTMDKDCDCYVDHDMGGPDCCASDPRVHPGQTGFFGAPTTCAPDGPIAAWDFNCDCKIDVEFGDQGDCSWGLFGCSTKAGFTSGVACGASGDYVKGCTNQAFTCTKTTMPTTQGCR